LTAPFALSPIGLLTAILASRSPPAMGAESEPIESVRFPVGGGTKTAPLLYVASFTKKEISCAPSLHFQRRRVAIGSYIDSICTNQPAPGASSEGNVGPGATGSIVKPGMTRPSTAKAPGTIGSGSKGGNAARNPSSEGNVGPGTNNNSGPAPAEDKRPTKADELLRSDNEASEQSGALLLCRNDPRFCAQSSSDGLSLFPGLGPWGSIRLTATSLADVQPFQLAERA
jgi:hypothetical protein